MFKKKLNDFARWAQRKVNELLADKYPALAQRINAVIDKAHKTLSDALNRVSDGLKKFVKDIADTTLKVINAALDLYESAVKIAMETVKAVVTGNFKDLGELLLTTVLEMAGISRADFDKMVGNAKDAIKALLDDPKTFLSNLIEAVKGGFTQFKDNFSTHFKNGVIGWLTGSLNGVVIPKNGIPKEYLHLP